uniref:Uncharacterized protein n=1 Tax=Haptolina brevifila TaxID=156173 RepID=A0A7S2E3R7_9EUKA
MSTIVAAAGTLSSPPSRSSSSALGLPPPTPRALEDAHRLQVLLARQRVEEAQHALLHAERMALLAEQEQRSAMGNTHMHQHISKVAAAARMRTLIHARHDSALRVALLAWWHAAASISMSPELEDDDMEADSGGMELVSSRGRPAVSLLEAALLHMNPMILHAAIMTWSRAVATWDRAAARVERTNAVLSSKWALQKAFAIEVEQRERMTRSILRWWSHAELKAIWQTWADLTFSIFSPGGTQTGDMCEASPQPAQSPHVRVNLPGAMY